MGSYRFWSGLYFKCQAMSLKNETGTWFWTLCLTMASKKERENRVS